ncbi:prenyltransferase [Kocuria sp.]|uniref:prenyltransferase n=1 Tax=Kocuria sp. TaxID=1871328 RepID=UPI0026E0501C|nr:prenyltransferase [Kocuria sp.]MDO5617689.1 prenyltransferase [Kocuria sp.]
MTYWELIVIFCALAAVPLAFLVGSGISEIKRKVATVGVVLGILVVLTIIFDSLIIMAGFVEYGQSTLSGIVLWNAPIEDLSYVVAGVLLLSALWWALQRPGHVKQQLSTWFTTSRPISWVNTAYPFAAAYFLSTGRVDDLLVIGSLFFLIPYNLMMYGINDVFDYESDLRNPRKGGVEGAVVPRAQHRGILVASLLTSLPFVIYLLVAGSVASALVLAVSLGAVVAYSLKGLRFKEIPFLDSATSATHFVSPMVFGLVLADATWSWSLVAVTVAFFLWGMASQAFGAVQDVTADREGGLASIATVLGARSTVWVAALMYLGAGALLLFTAWPGPVAALFVLPYLANVIPFLGLNDADSHRAHLGWKRFLWINYLVGFAVTMLLIYTRMAA